MELRHYWRVLWRRRMIVLYTCILVSLLAGAYAGYTWYTSQWLGTTQITLSVQPLEIKGAVFDPNAAADGTTVNVEQDIANYAGTVDYFMAVSNRLKAGHYATQKDWKAIRNGLKVFQATSGHAIFIEWPSSKSREAVDIVRAGSAALVAYIPYYRTHLRPKLPAISWVVQEQPVAIKQSLSRLAVDIALRVALGIIAGVILAYLFEYLDDTVQDELDVQQWTGLPTLGVIPGGRQARRARTA